MDIERIFTELARNGDILSALLSGTTQEQARVKPNRDSWSILEVVCHLLDEERLDFRTRLNITLSRSGEKWAPIDPIEWVTAKQYNERRLEDVLAEFLAERYQSLAWLREYQSPDWGSSYEAPFGRITAGDLLASWVVHDLLHIRQLVELQHEKLLRTVSPYSTAYAGDW